MESFWMPVSGIPAEGAEFTLSDQEIWLGPIKEFGLPCSIEKPLEARIHVLPQEDGLLLRGRISGRVVMPCDRCAEEAAIDINSSFEEFEPYPAEEIPLEPAKGAKFKDESGPKSLLDNEVDNNVMRFSPNGPRHAKEIEVNLAALAWEEFSLALPVKPLCAEGCAGLCPVCGSEAGGCACEKNEGDPRLAVLRGLTITRKQ